VRTIIVADWNSGLSKYEELLFIQNTGGYAWAQFLYNELYYYYYGSSPAKLP